MDVSSAETRTAHRKRQKVFVACAPCRRKKVKCDAVHPICTGCQRSSDQQQCLYTSRRINKHETPHLAPPSKSTAMAKDRSNASGSMSSDGPSLPGGEDYLVQSQGCPASCGVDTMTGLLGDTVQTREQFGSSSAGTFTKLIQAAAKNINHSEEQPLQDNLARMVADHSLDEPPVSSYGEPALMALPARDLADCLIQSYWECEWSLYPIVDRPKIEAVYQTAWDVGGPSCSPTTLSLINLCFALGCAYSSVIPPKDRKAMSEDFFTRAEALYRKIQYLPSLEKVQCLLLFSIYLQSTDHVFRCWMTVGEAIRMAQSLGIYQNQPASSTESAAYREQKRRTWHGCVWLDRVMSATLGRPGMIPDWLFNSVPLPAMIDDEFLDKQTTSSALRPDGKPCTLAFTVKAFELYQLFDIILQKVYLGSNGGEDYQNKLNPVLEFDREIQAWEESLPVHLRYHSGMTRDALADRQATILRIRLLHIRIVSLRPSLIRHCKPGASTYAAKPQISTSAFLSQVIQSEFPRICFQCAHELIDLFTARLDPESMTGPLPSWWYSVLYVYTSATVILVERFLETKNNIPEQRSNALRGWNAAVRILQSYSLVADSATKCLITLEALSETLFGGQQGDTVTGSEGAHAEARYRNLFLEMTQLLGEKTTVPPFDFDDFLWLG
ncbi:transcriptional regulator family: Fungal Specific TF [Aspergillus niger]|nr:transcriptional regulator family: Fungal Specific TF [Aspergillus niger]